MSVREKMKSYNPSKEICTFLVFLHYTSSYLKFCIFEMAWSLVKGFQKCIFDHFWTFFLYNWILQKNKHSSFANLLSNDISIVIFGHQTCNLKGNLNWPSNLHPTPQCILVFKYTSRDLVKNQHFHHFVLYFS